MNKSFALYWTEARRLRAAWLALELFQVTFADGLKLADCMAGGPVGYGELAPIGEIAPETLARWLHLVHQPFKSGRAGSPRDAAYSLLGQVCG